MTLDNLDTLNSADYFAEIVHSMLSMFAPRGVTTFRFRTVGTAEFLVTDLAFDKVRDVEITSSSPYNLTTGVRRRFSLPPRSTRSALSEVCFVVDQGFFCTQANFSQLLGFIQKLPNLRRLVFTGLAVDVGGQAFVLGGLEETQLIIQYPMLYALLSFVTRTFVTTLILAPDDGPTAKRYRWTRQYRHEQLRLE